MILIMYSSEKQCSDFTFTLSDSWLVEVFGAVFRCSELLIQRRVEYISMLMMYIYIYIIIYILWTNT